SGRGRALQRLGARHRHRHQGGRDHVPRYRFQRDPAGQAAPVVHYHGAVCSRRHRGTAADGHRRGHRGRVVVGEAPSPREVEKVRMDQAAALRNLMEETRRPTAAADQAGIRSPNGQAAPATGPRLLAITSGKGGVGKSNVSVNLGLCLARMGRRTWLWDVDLGLGNADILLGLSPRYDLGHVVFGDRTLEEIVIEGPEGLRLIPGGSGWHQLAQLSQWRLNRLVSDLTSLGSDADFILMDTGAGLGRGVIQFALAAREVIIVTTPEPTALTDAYGLLKVVFDVNPGVRVYLVINQARHSGEAHEAYQRLNDAVERF